MKLSYIEIWAIIAALLLSFGFVLYTYDKTLKVEKENEYLREQIAYSYLLEVNDTGIVIGLWWSGYRRIHAYSSEIGALYPLLLNDNK